LGDGAYLDNTYGNGDITVSFSFFADGSDIDIPSVGNTGDGLELWTCGDATVGTTELAFNGGYGLIVNVGGTYTEGVLVMGGNGSGDDPLINIIDCSSPTKRSPGPASSILPLHIVHVASGESVELDCALYRGTMLVLPQGDSLTFLCPTQGDASASSLTNDGLPGDLPEGNTFASALSGALTGGESAPLPRAAVVSFVILDGLQDAILAILFWDGSAWVEVDGSHKTSDGHFEATTNFTGTFVLVSR
jgi:hypothetical protein